MKGDPGIAGQTKVPVNMPRCCEWLISSCVSNACTLRKKRALSQSDLATR